MSQHIKFLILSLLCSLTTYAATLSPAARVSLLTCEPGEQLYARYGHTAIRVADPNLDLDIVFNYGLFSFDTDHFYWKFVRGETWYQLGYDAVNNFLLEYKMDGRKVHEQVLNLTPSQCDSVLSLLIDNYRPENRKYLYNFVFDNCATRPLQLIRSVLPDTIQSAYDGYEGRTYREFISHYTRPGSWEDFGINLLFGPKADKPMIGQERLFLPEEVMFYLSQATVNNQSLIHHERIEHFSLRHIPWYQTWYFGIAMLALLLVIISLYDRQRGKISLWADAILMIVYLVILLIVIFLTFFSLHPLVGFGWRLLIIPTIHLCARLIYWIR